MWLFFIYISFSLFVFRLEISINNSEEMVLAEDVYVLWQQERIRKNGLLDSAGWWVFNVILFETAVIVKINKKMFISTVVMPLFLSSLCLFCSEMFIFLSSVVLCSYVFVFFTVIYFALVKFVCIFRNLKATFVVWISFMLISLVTKLFFIDCF
jgi:hypothetical protein